MEGFATTVSAMTDLTQAGFQQWVNLGVFRRIAEELVQDLYERVCMPGFKTSGVWFCAGNTVLATSWVSCSSVVQLYSSGYFEMDSNDSTAT
jgi:hypothetical protein